MGEDTFDSLLSSTAPLTPKVTHSARGVSFTPGVVDSGASAKPPSTPHPKSGRKREPSPCSARKVSLMPMADVDEELTTKNTEEPLISFESPELSRRRSKRI